MSKFFRNICAVNATEQDASLSKVSYLCGGIVSLVCLLWHTWHANEVNWPLVAIWAAVLIYHLGPHMAKQVVDLLITKWLGK